MPGFLFYWISWCIWIYLMFIMKKTHPYRYPLAFFVCLAIIFSGYTIELFGMEIRLSLFPMWLLGCLLLAKCNWKTLMYLCLCVVIITFSATTFFIMALFDPFWVIIDLVILEGLLAVFLTSLLDVGFWQRIGVFFIGFIQAELLYGYLLKGFGIHYEIGSLHFLDGLSVSLVFIILWGVIETIYLYFQRNQILEKEKQL